jgi:hypothetical protein
MASARNVMASARDVVANALPGGKEAGGECAGRAWPLSRSRKASFSTSSRTLTTSSFSLEVQPSSLSCSLVSRRSPVSLSRPPTIPVLSPWMQVRKHRISGNEYIYFGILFQETRQMTAILDISGRNDVLFVPGNAFQRRGPQP